MEMGDTIRPKAAVLGATKFGRWHVREYLSAGCDVVAILGSSDESARKTAGMLKEGFGCEPRAYGSINRLLDQEEIDLISIVTPPQTHYELGKFAIARGIDFLMEKPPVRGVDSQETFRMYSSLMENAKKAGVTFANQQQNVAFLGGQFPSILGRNIDNAKYFKFHVVSGGSGSGMVLAEDQLPHPLSMLTKVMGPGEVSNIYRNVEEGRPVEFKFDYESERGKCSCSFYFEQIPDLPREKNVMRITFDDDEISRRQSGSGADLKQWFEYNDREYPLKDPLSISISSFVGGNPLVSAEDGLNSLKAQLDLLQYS